MKYRAKHRDYYGHLIRKLYPEKRYRYIYASVHVFPAADSNENLFIYFSDRFFTLE